MLACRNVDALCIAHCAAAAAAHLGGRHVEHVACQGDDDVRLTEADLVCVWDGRGGEEEQERAQGSRGQVRQGVG